MNGFGEIRSKKVVAYPFFVGNDVVGYANNLGEFISGNYPQNSAETWTHKRQPKPHQHYIRTFIFQHESNPDPIEWINRIDNLFDAQILGNWGV
jgi:hypothetical protein